MDAINTAVLAELQEYAQLYFSAIVELHTVEGKCNLKPGKYSAKELVDNLKAACGSYGLPADEIFNEDPLSPYLRYIGAMGGDEQGRKAKSGI